MENWTARLECKKVFFPTNKINKQGNRILGVKIHRMLYLTCANPVLDTQPRHYRIFQRTATGNGIYSVRCLPMREQNMYSNPNGRIARWYKEERQYDDMGELIWHEFAKSLTEANLAEFLRVRFKDRASAVLSEFLNAMPEQQEAIAA